MAQVISKKIKIKRAIFLVVLTAIVVVLYKQFVAPIVGEIIDERKTQENFVIVFTISCLVSGTALGKFLIFLSKVFFPSKSF